MTILIGVFIAILFYILGLSTNWYFHEHELKKLRLTINRECEKNHRLEKQIAEREKGDKEFTSAHESVLTFLNETEEALKELRQRYNKLREDNSFCLSHPINTPISAHIPFPNRFNKSTSHKNSKSNKEKNNVLFVATHKPNNDVKQEKLDQDSKIGAIRIAVVSNLHVSSNHHRMIKTIHKANS